MSDVTAQIHRAPAPCDRPAPESGLDPHSHEDGRRCVWEDGAWVTVTSISEPVEPVKVDKKDRGLEPKFYVHRVDGRDAPGGDRHDAQHGYFVLDCVFDPIARPALALYAVLARQRGYEVLADDIEANLRVLYSMAGDVMPNADIRAVATWSYPQPPEEAYRGLLEEEIEGLSVAVKAALDVQEIDRADLAPEDIVGQGNEGTFKFTLLPDA